MKARELEDAIVGNFRAHFGSEVSGFTVSDVTDIPFTQVTVQMTVFNYLVVQVFIERGGIFVSILESRVALSLLSVSLSSEALLALPAQVDEEVRLRIPDKYLRAKGWLVDSGEMGSS